jgi:MYXO-CTERM domain-containing protein
VLGFYILFAMVDDIPSEGQVVQIAATANLRGCSMAAIDPSWLGPLLALLALGLARRRRNEPT